MNTFKIEIGGKSYTLLFGYTCYKLFMTRCFKFKDTYLTEEGELTGLGLANLFHSAYISHCYDKQTDITLTYDDFLEWTDKQYATEEGIKIIADALEVWAAGKEVRKLVEEADKKKAENGVSQTLAT